MKAPEGLVITPERFRSRLRSPATAARVGRWLGVTMLVAFATGLLSHLAQLPQPPIPLPTSPSWGYRVTQGLHVASGTAAIPLLLVKLWIVYPRLFERPPRRLGQLLVVALERGSIAVLVASALLELTIGVMNVAQWYAWRFDFRATHYALAFVLVGSLVVHVGVKLPVIRAALGANIDDTTLDRPGADVAGSLTRRGLVRTGYLSALVAVAVTSTVAGTTPWLGRLAVLSARSPGRPVNRTAVEAAVVAPATSSSYRCRVVVGTAVHAFTRADLLALPQTEHDLPIACVEGWSYSARWRGVALRDLLDHVGAPRGHDLLVVSIQPGLSAESTTRLPAAFVDDPRTLLALGLDGGALPLDHGYPVRLVAPDRPGALQTKWVGRLEVLA